MKANDPRAFFAPNLLKMYLVDYVVNRTPKSRIADAPEVVPKWVDEYLTDFKDEVSAKVASLPNDFSVEELPMALPGFVAFMKKKDPGLHEKPTGMY